MEKEINWLEKIQETAAFIKEKVGGEMPKVAKDVNIKVFLPISLLLLRLSSFLTVPFLIN